MVAHNLAKVRVASSSLVIRSTFWTSAVPCAFCDLVSGMASRPCIFRGCRLCEQEDVVRCCCFCCSGHYGWMLGVFVGAVPIFAVESHDIGGAVLIVTGTTYEKFVKTGLITTDDSTRVLFGDHLTAKAVCSAGADNKYVVKNGLNLSIEIFDTETYYVKSELLHNYSGTSTNGTLKLKEPAWTENQFIRVVCDTATESILLMLLERKLVKSHFMVLEPFYHRICAEPRRTAP